MRMRSFIVASALLGALAFLSTFDPASTTRVGNFAGTIIFPAAVSGNVDDWAPVGLDSATTIMASLSADAEITSLTGGVDGRRIDICNTSAFILTVGNNVGGSGTDANKFFLAGQANWTLGTAGMSCASFVYDGTALRWRMYAKTGSTYPSVTVTTSATAGTTTTPTGSLTVYGVANNLQVFRAAGIPSIVLNRADTSLSAPSAVGTGEALGAFLMQGYNGASYITSGSVIGRSSQAFTGIANGEQLEFNSVNVGATAESTGVVVVGPGNRMSVGTGISNPSNNSLQSGPADGSFVTAFGAHVNANGDAVSITSCGAGAACNSTSCNDTAGTFTVGTASTTCTITFVNSYGGADDATCQVWPIAAAVLPTFTTSATAITFSVVVASRKYHYICLGH